MICLKQHPMRQIIVRAIVTISPLTPTFVRVIIRLDVPVIVTIAPVIATIAHVIVTIAHVIVTIAHVIVTIVNVSVSLVIDKIWILKNLKLNLNLKYFLKT